MSKTSRPAATIAPRRTPEEIAAAATARAESIRRESWTADVAEWRALVVAIADGAEPDGPALQRIAELAAALELPQGSLASHVRLVQAERALAADHTKAAREGKAAEERMPALGDEVRAAEARLAELRAEADANWLAQQTPCHLAQRLAEMRREHRILFQPLDELRNANGSKSSAREVLA